MTPDADDRAPHPTEDLAASTCRSAPPPANAHARTRRYGPFTVVEVMGEIDLASEVLLAGHLNAATAKAESDVLVDLRRVDFFRLFGTARPVPGRNAGQGPRRPSAGRVGRAADPAAAAQCRSTGTLSPPARDPRGGPVIP